MNKKEIMEHLKSQDLDYIRSLVRGLGLRLYKESEVDKEKLQNTKKYIEGIEVKDKGNKGDFQDITPPTLKGKNVVVYNSKNGEFGIQYRESYMNKISFKSLSEYDQFLDRLEDLDEVFRTFLNIFSNGVSSPLPKFEVEF